MNLMTELDAAEIGRRQGAVEELVADTLEGFGMEDEEGNPIADETAEEESYFEVESFDSADDEQY